MIKYKFLQITKGTANSTLHLFLKHACNFCGFNVMVPELLLRSTDVIYMRVVYADFASLHGSNLLEYQQ